MNHTKIVKTLLVLILVFRFGATYAQADCSEILVQANLAYNQGKYEQVISLLQPMIDDCEFDKLDKEQATKLLASALFKIDEEEAADSLVYQLLKKNPTYRAQATIDPKPFVKALDKFERSPRSVIGINVGYNTPFTKTEKVYPVWDAADYSSGYETESSLSLSLHYQYFINKKLSIGLAPEISSLKLSRTISAPNMVNVTYSEKANVVKTPLLVGYEVFKKNNFSTTLSAGLYGSYTYGHKYNINYQLAESGVIESEGILQDQRNTMNYGYQAGIDLAYTKNKLRFSAKLDYSSDIKLYNNPDNRYNTNSLLMDYNYVDDDIKMSNLGIKLGVAYTLFYKIKHKYRSK